MSLNLITEHCETFADFARYIDEKQRIQHGVVWRGQADSNWGITSSAFRHAAIAKRVLGHEPERFKESDINRWQEMNFHASFSLLREGLLSEPDYRIALGPLLSAPEGALDDEDQNEIWAIGQHFGLKTPLVDWTRSPYVALFFACAEVVECVHEIERGRTVAAWGMVPDAVAPYICDAAGRDYFYFLKPKLGMTPRLRAQSGCFSRLAPDGDLIERLRGVKSNEWDYVPDIFKIELPASLAPRILEHLARMNISHRTLFPDLQGLMQFGNLASLNSSMTGLVFGRIPAGYNMRGCHHFERHSRQEDPEGE